MEESTRVVRNYMTLTGLYTLAASIIWGVNSLFLLDAGLTLLQLFVVNSIFTGAMALFEIPTGVLADTRGRRASFLLSIVILIIGTVGYVVAGQFENNLWLFVIASIVLGLGYTFYSGAMEAWLVDALTDTGFTGKLDDIFARSSMISGGAMLIGSLAGGVLGSWHLSIPYWIRVGLLTAVYLYAYATMHDLGFSPHKVALTQLPHEMGKIAKASIQYGWQTPSVRLLIMAGFVQAIFMAWGFFAWQPYFLELLGQNAPWVAGVISALVALATMGGNGIVEWAAKRCGRRTTLFAYAAVIQTVAIVVVGLTNSFWIAVSFYLLAMVTLGVWGPVKQAYMHEIIPSEQRATVISFESLIGSSGSVIGQNGLGKVSQLFSLGSGYVVGGFATLFVWPLIWALRKRDDAVDFIVGEAGRDGACAAQGLPAVTAVDSHAGTIIER